MGRDEVKGPEGGGGDDAEGPECGEMMRKALSRARGSERP